jgi:23S rRNA pseudouridine2605 synthase
MRLNAYLAKTGISSRRGADVLIEAGKVTVNGSPGKLYTEVFEGDDVGVSGERVIAQKMRYLLLYKPAGYISTLKDPHGRRKILDLLSISERVVPVGRLDYDTTGAILLTNDGELAHRLMHPSFGVDKVYEATTDGKITDEIIKKLEQGVELEDGKTSPAKARRLSANKVELTVHEGRKHQIKRMLAAVGLPVKQLHRSKYSGLDLVGLKPGEWRNLTPREVARLKRYTSKSEKNS